MSVKNWIVTILASLACYALVSCSNQDYTTDSGVKIPPPKKFDIDSIIARGTLILLTENSATSYYEYRGHARGFDYEMARAFATHLGVKLEVVLLDDLDRMFELLNTGKGDLIATNLTVTPSRKKIVRFGSPVNQTRQVLVQKKSGLNSSNEFEHSIHDTADLAGKNVWVHRYSVFYQRLKELERNLKMPIIIHEAPGEISTDDLIRLTDEGQVEYTVTDENLAELEQNECPGLDMSFAISESQDIAWALRKNSSKLADTLDKWLTSEKTQKLLHKTQKKYFNTVQRTNYNPVFVLPKLNGKQISVYDTLFKKYAPEIGWDWRLLAALVFQESRFNPQAKSWSGAYGLMQLMPETAERFGCDTSQVEEPNIRAGVAYIKYLDGIWKNRIPDKNERLKFILASYNIGPGHIFDAQKIATHLNLNDTVWYNNVAECILLKTQEKYYTLDGVKHGYCYGKEPYHFVSKIMAVYEYYVSLNL